MAEAGKEPVLPDTTDALAAFERDLPKVLQGATLEALGWRRLDDLTLIVPLQGRRHDGLNDEYVLRLAFDYYDEWPPSAQFVNPKTFRYDAGKDKCWLPKVEGTNEIQVHPEFQFGPQKMQLICSSVTLEFYIVKHGVNPEHVWNRQKQNFSATINQIEWALKSQFYKGRHCEPPPQ